MNFRKEVVNLFFGKVSSYLLNELEVALSNISYNDFIELVSMDELKEKINRDKFEAIEYLLNALEK